MDLIYGLILIDSLLAVLLIFLWITNSIRHKELLGSHADLLLNLARHFNDSQQGEIINREAIFLRLRQIDENTKHLNFKTQLLEMKMEDHIKAYHLTPVPTPKQVQVIQRRRRARSNKKPPIARGPNKDLV